MPDDWMPITYEQAAARLVDGEVVQTFMQAGALHGADWDRDQVLACLREPAETGELAEAGANAKAPSRGIRAMSLGIAIWFETKPGFEVGSPLGGLDHRELTRWSDG